MVCSDGDFTVAILANGAMIEGAQALNLFKSAHWLVCCDGAYQKALKLGREPDVVVGDGDSLSLEEKSILGEKLVVISEQETNDLTKAFMYVAKKFSGENVKIVILGAMGLREDHLLGNIFHLPDFASVNRNVSMWTDTGIFEVVLDEKTFACNCGDAVSVFAPIADTAVQSEGLKWPLDGVDLSALWSGTLNKTTSDSFTLKTNKPIIVWRQYAV